MPINLTNYELLTRSTLGLILILLGAHYNLWWTVVLVGLPLVYTAVIRSCPIYSFFGINTSVVRENYYLSALPKNNPEPVMLFDLQGELVFKNNAATTVLSDIRNINELVDTLPDTLENLIHHNHAFIHSVSQ